MLQWAPQHMELLLPSMKAWHEGPGKIHDAYYQPALEIDVLHSQVKTYKQATSERQVIKAFYAKSQHAFCRSVCKQL